MKRMLIFTMMMTGAWASAQEIYDFSTERKSSDWIVVDDVVMGGRSEGNFHISDEGYGVFTGTISLDNNGGFSSVRHQRSMMTCEDCTMFRIRLKGDGKNYQFRIRTSINDYQSYIYEFQTTGNWQVVDIPFKDMYPGWRGRKLNIPNYPGEKLQECSFLIANKKNESFRLEIDRIAIL